MNTPTLLDFSFALLLNAALLLSVAQVADLLLARGRVNWLSRPNIVAGLLVGLVGILLIRVSITLIPGVIFDTRSVLLAVSGLFLGPLPTAIAMAMTAAYRWSLGGVAAMTGVAVILASGLIGLAWRQAWRRPLEEMGWRPLYALGLVVHLVMLALMLLMPWQQALAVLARISLPVLLIYPLITLALGLFLADRLRRSREQAILREQEARYRSLFENDHTVMLIIDPEDGVITDANAAAADYYGWPRERLTGMNIAEINPLAPGEVRDRMGSAPARQRRPCESRHRCADGSLRDVEVFSGPIQIGERTYLFSIVHDIGTRKATEAALLDSETARRREQDETLRTQEEARQAALNLMEDAVAARREAEAALDALRVSEERFHDIVSVSSDWVWEVDPEGRYTFASGRVQELLGYSPGEILGKTAFDLMPPDEAARVGAEFAAIVARRAPFRDLYNVNLHKDGSIRHVISYGMPIFGAGGELLGYRGLDKDVGAQKRAEIALRDSEAFKRAILDSVTAQIAVLDRNGVILAVNEPWRRFALEDCGTPGSPAGNTGEGVDYLAICQASTGHASEGDMDALAGIRAVLDGGLASFNLEYPCHSPGRQRWFNMSVTPLGEARRGVVITHIDISDRKLNEVILDLEARRSQALLALPKAAEEMDERAFMQYGQELAEQLTGSRIAFIHFVNEDQETIELVTWSHSTLEHYCRAAFDSHYPISQAGIWADALRRREPVVFNDYASAPGKHGLPEGHAELLRLISVPVIEGGLVRMMAGVGNKPEPYSDMDVETVRLIANTIWHVISQRRFDAALRASTDMLTTVLENVPVRVFWKDLESRYLGCNVEFAHDAGCAAPAELIGRTDFDMGWKDQAELYRADDRAVMESGVPRLNFEEPQTTPDGRTIWLRTSKVPLHGADDQVIGILGVYEDITDRKRVEDELRKLSLAVEQSPESIVITDLDGHIEYVNDAFLRVTGYTREEVLGQNPRILHSGRTPPETFTEMWAALTAGQPWKGEFHNRRKDGSEYVEFAIVTPIRQPDGRITHYVAVKEDISEKKRLGQELDQYRYHLEELVLQRTNELVQAREQAEAANRAKSAFLANMSHEIRTPMNAIVGLAYLLRTGADRAQGEKLAKIDAAARHLLAIINDILDLSKIDVGKINLEQGDFHLLAVLDHVRSLVAASAQAKGIELVVDCDAVPPLAAGGPHPAAPGPAQLRGQCGEVHRTGPYRPARPSAGGAGRHAAGALRGGGQRHRHRCRGAATAVPGLRAGGQRYQPPLRWHRPGPGHHPSPGAHDGGRGGGGERAWPGQPVLVHRPAGPRPRPGWRGGRKAGGRRHRVRTAPPPRRSPAAAGGG